MVVRNNDDLSSAGDVRVSSKVNFTAVSGTTYMIAVSGWTFQGNGQGSISLNWNLLPPPGNDNFADAQTISDTSGVVVGTNAGATKEQGEPNHADNPGGASIWYRWTAPSSGTFTFNTSSSRISCDGSSSGCGYDTLLAVYKGESLEEISLAQNLVAKNDNATPQAVTSSVSFDAVVGTTYRIAVDSTGIAKSDIVLSWIFGSSQTASFANAIQISGVSGNTNMAVGGNGEIWFRWTAPDSGSVSFSSGIFFSPSRNNFQYPSTLSLYSVSGESTLSLISTNTGPCTVTFNDRFCQPTNASFSAVAQTIYAVQITKPSESVGPANLSWNQSGGTIAPANDNFTAAQVIGGFNSGVSGISFNNTGATKEPGETDHGGNPGGRSIWFDWKAPETFRVTFFTNSFSGQMTSVFAYTGSSVSNLTSLAGGSSATFDAVKDTIYHIAVVDSIGQGAGSLIWNPTIAPPNDNFVNARSIDATSGKVLATNINATGEAGEPLHAGSTIGASIWYSWTAPQNGLFTFNTDSSDVDTILAVYTGSVLNNLAPVVSNNNNDSATFPFSNTSRVTFFALAGQSYKIAVTASFGTGTIRLQWGLARSISGRVTNIRGVGIANTLVTLDGDGKRTRLSDAQGFYNFADVPDGLSYVVTPSTASYTYDFASRSYNPLTADITDANFVALTPVYSISGRITSAGVGVANVTVNLTGTINTSVVTNSRGSFIFRDLTTNGNYTVTPSSPSYTFSAFSPEKDRYFFPVLNDNYDGADFTASAVSRTLKVNSSNPNSGVSISISPNDTGGSGAGETPLTRTYADSTVVTLTAPAVAGGTTFQKWLRDGADFSNNQSTPVTMDADHTMTAVYVTPTSTLTVASSNPNSGVDITVTPVDNNSQGSGSTQFTRTYNINTNVTLTAPATKGSNNFQKWLRDGADFSTDQSTTVTMNADHTMTAVYVTPTRTLTVASSNPNSGVDITVMPLDNNSQGSGSTQFTRTYNINTNVTLIAPSTTGNNIFQKWQKDGIDYATSASTNVSLDADYTMTAVYLATPQIQLLLEDSATPTTQAAALDAVLFIHDPFPVVNTSNLLTGPDHNTRVLLFVKNVQLEAGETAAGAIVVHLVGANGQSYDVPAENLFSLSGFDFSQLTFRLPDTLVPGACTIEVRAHGQVSNLGTIRIRM